MKRLIALFLALIMCFTLCSCGDSGQTNSQEDSIVNVENENSEQEGENNPLVGVWVNYDSFRDEYYEFEYIAFSSDGYCYYDFIDWFEDYEYSEYIKTWILDYPNPTLSTLSDLYDYICLVCDDKYDSSDDPFESIVQYTIDNDTITTIDCYGDTESYLIITSDSGEISISDGYCEYEKCYPPDEISYRYFVGNWNVCKTYYDTYWDRQEEYFSMHCLREDLKDSNFNSWSYMNGEFKYEWMSLCACTPLIISANKFIVNDELQRFYYFERA